MKHSYFILHIAVLCLGLSGVLGKVIQLNEAMLTWFRVFFAAIALFLILKWAKVPHTVSRCEKWAIAKNGLYITASWLLFYASIKYANISIAVVCYCMASFFTAIFAPLINRTAFRKSEFLLSTLTLLGIALIFHFEHTRQLGIAFGVISPAFASLYAIHNEKLVRKYHSVLINYYQMIGGTLGLGLALPFFLYFYPASTFVPRIQDIFYLIVLALGCTVAVYLAFTEILKKISAFTLNLSLNLEPVYAIVLAFLFFGESRQVNLAFYAGLALVILSVVLQHMLNKKRE
ncbi:EamA family transporter [Sphingobacterium thalpophilum]|uniref:EamA family transporter n=1 Tax=Sphingobacterium thalpophilum TaxID=259 RepID=A0ABV4HAL5_9SPHI